MRSLRAGVLQLASFLFTRRTHRATAADRMRVVARLLVGIADRSRALRASVLHLVLGAWAQTAPVSFTSAHPICARSAHTPTQLTRRIDRVRAGDADLDGWRNLVKNPADAATVAWPTRRAFPSALCAQCRGQFLSVLQDVLLMQSFDAPALAPKMPPLPGLSNEVHARVGGLALCVAEGAEGPRLQSIERLTKSGTVFRAADEWERIKARWPHASAMHGPR